MIQRIALALSLLLTSLPAQAALHPDEYRNARREAPYHLQVKVTRVTTSITRRNRCEIEARVVTEFRDTQGDMGAGTPIRFTIPCYHRADAFPGGCTPWALSARIKAAKYMETYMTRRNGKLQLALWQWKAISSPSNAPQFPVEAKR